MSRLVIDVTGEQHQQIKALASLQGKTIKEFILERVFSDNDENKDWEELEALLASRIKDAETTGVSTKSFEHITADVIKANKKT